MDFSGKILYCEVEEKKDSIRQLIIWKWSSHSLHVESVFCKRPGFVAAVIILIVVVCIVLKYLVVR